MKHRVIPSPLPEESQGTRVCLRERVAPAQSFARTPRYRTPLDGYHMRVADIKPLAKALNPALVISSRSRTAPSVMVPTQPSARWYWRSLPPKTNQPLPVVQILNHNNLWAGQLCDVSTYSAQLAEALALWSHVAGFDFHRDRPANHRPHLRHEISRHLVVNPSAADQFPEICPSHCKSSACSIALAATIPREAGWG